MACKACAGARDLHRRRVHRRRAVRRRRRRRRHGRRLRRRHRSPLRDRLLLGHRHHGHLPARATPRTNCGKDGAACAACDTTAGQTCNTTTQACTGAAVTAVGNPCATAADCTGLTDAVCKLKTGLAGIGTYTDGYCTRPCTSNTDCGSDALCLTFGPADDEPTGKFCSKKCPHPVRAVDAAGPATPATA